MKRFSLSARSRLRLASLPAICATLAVATPAFAQEAEPPSVDFSVQRLESAPGPNNVLSTERVRMVEQFGWSAGLLFNYSREPFVVVSCIAEANCDEPNATEVEDVPVVQDMFQFDLMGSFNPIEWMQIGLKVPLAYVSGAGINTETGQPAAEGLGTFGLGDVLLEGKFRFFGDSASVVALGGAVDVAAPLGHLTAANSFIGNDAPVTVGWRGIADFQIEKFFAVANLRGVYRGENTLGTTTVGPLEFRYAVGAGYEITPIIKVMAEGYGSTQFSSTKGTNTLETDAAVVISPLDTGLSFTAGGGVGVLSGVGVPVARAIGGITFSMESGDADGDGVADNRDQCPAAKEDEDEFEDSDGCPDEDNDKDGIADAKDKCPNKAETVNGWEDEDGCPDDVKDTDQDGIADPKDKCPDLPGRVLLEEFYGCPDTDSDGLPDPKDKCPKEAEDTDGFDDTDGCPDPDNDNDGVLDANDECPEELEIKNGFKDEDGCSDTVPDTDKDGIPDTADKCPTRAETFNGIDDEDGCPEAGRALVEVGKEEIKILQRIEFETGSDKIKGKESFAVLDAVAGALKANPQIFQVECAGHTDSAGVAQMNKDLSQKRANAVKAYIESKGIAATRLTAVGYGQDKPISDNATTAGKQKNRRVEFKITHSPTIKAPEKPAAPPAAPADPPKTP